MMQAIQTWWQSVWGTVSTFWQTVFLPECESLWAVLREMWQAQPTFLTGILPLCGRLLFWALAAFGAVLLAQLLADLIGRRRGRRISLLCTALVAALADAALFWGGFAAWIY